MAAELDVPQSTVSRHLKVLRDCSLVETTRQANQVTIPWPTSALSRHWIFCAGILRDRVLRQASVVTKKETETAG